MWATNYSQLIAAYLILICIALQSIHSGSQDMDLERLGREGILVEKVNNENGLPGIRAMFTMEASRAELWGMLTDYENFSRIYGGIDSLRIIREDPSYAIVEFYQTTLFKKIHYILQRNYVKEGYSLTWELVGGDLEYVHGSWQILETGEEAILLVTYTNYFKHGGIIPTRITRRWAMSQVRQMAENARNWIRQNRDLYS
jgi:hypothetical protein